MRSLFDISLKDMLVVGKDRGAWMLLLVTPLVVIVVASFALAPAFQENGINAKLLVSNNDIGQAGREFVKAIESNENVTILSATDDECKNLEQGKDKYTVGLVIPADFSTKVLSGAPSELEVYVDPSNNVTRPILVGMINEITMRMSAVQIATSVAVTETLKFQPSAEAGAVAGDAAAEASKQAGDQPIKATVTNAKEQKDVNPFDTQVPGYAVMFLLFGVLGSAEGLLEERDKGTLGRLLVAPVSRASILGGKLLAQFIVGLIQITLLFAVGHFVFDMSLGNSIPGLALMITVTAFTATAFGILLASLVKTRRQMSAIGVLAVLLMSALGGSWWPLEIVPDFMQKLGHVTINAWALDGINDLILRAGTFTEILPDAGVLFAYGVICFIVGISFFKFRSA